MITFSRSSNTSNGDGIGLSSRCTDWTRSKHQMLGDYQDINYLHCIFSYLGSLPMPDFDRSLDNHFLVAKGCHEVKRWSLFGYFFLCPASWTGCAHKTRYLIHRTDRLSAHIFAQLFYCSFINIRSSIPLFDL